MLEFEIKLNIPQPLMLCRFLSDYQLVCHPFQWKHTNASGIITRLTKHATIATINKGIQVSQ
jgi:hypothetical protein